MKNQFAYQQKSHLDKVMTTEQFNQIVDAILAGKYSWACVLILRFAGYNPLHYIPYRTYNRLLKDHRQATKNSQTKLEKSTKSKANQSNSQVPPQRLSQITDLNYLEVVNDKNQSIHGGYRESYWTTEVDYLNLESLSSEL